MATNEDVLRHPYVYHVPLNVERITCVWPRKREQPPLGGLESIDSAASRIAFALAVGQLPRDSPIKTRTNNISYMRTHLIVMRPFCRGYERRGQKRGVGGVSRLSNVKSCLGYLASVDYFLHKIFLICFSFSSSDFWQPLTASFFVRPRSSS